MHWTCASPRPALDERTAIVGSKRLDAALRLAESFLRVTADPFPPNPAVSAVRSVLTRVFPDLPRQVQALPMAVTPAGGAARRAWNGVDTILAPAATREVKVLARVLARRLGISVTKSPPWRSATSNGVNRLQSGRVQLWWLRTRSIHLSCCGPPGSGPVPSAAT